MIGVQIESRWTIYQRFMVARLSACGPVSCKLSACDNIAASGLISPPDPYIARSIGVGVLDPDSVRPRSSVWVRFWRSRVGPRSNDSDRVRATGLRNALTDCAVAPKRWLTS